MKNLHLITIYLFTYLNHKICTAVNETKIDKIDSVIKYILNETQPYQVLVFLQNYEDKYRKDTNHQEVYFIIQQISIVKPVLIIKSSKLKDPSVYVHFQHPLLRDLRYTTLFISLMDVNVEHEDSIQLMINNLKENLEFIISLSPSTIRPLYLFIVNTNKKISIDSFKIILNYAWKKKFLEFTILQILSKDGTCKNDFLLNTYNPFINYYYTSYFFNGITVFFNKLKKMNNYPFKVAIVRRPPAINFDRDSSGNPINLKGYDYGALTIIADYLNVTLNLIAPNVSTYMDPIKNNESTLLELIIHGEIDYGANQDYMYFNMENMSKIYSEHSDVTWLDEIIALVPIFPSSLWIQFNTAFLMLGILAHVSLMYLFIKICKFDTQYWPAHYIFQILLGNTAAKLPKRSIERLFFVFLFILSHKYSTNWYAKLADENLNTFNTGPYETLSDLENSDIIIETYKLYAGVVFYEKNGIIGSLHKKVKLVRDMTECPNRVLQNLNVACLIDKSLAEDNILRSTQNNSPKVKIMNYVFWTGPKGFIFSAASPYVLAFNRIIERINESATWVRWDVSNENINYKMYSIFYDKNSINIFDHFFKKKLIVMWLSGCFVSTAAFFGELLVKMYKNIINPLK